MISKLLTKCLSFSFVSFIYIQQKYQKYQTIPNPTHHHGHFPLNHPVNPRCILIKLSNISRNDIYIEYRILKTQYCPRPNKNNNNNMKISCVRPHTHTNTHLRCLAIDINRIIERSINQSCNLLCFICVSCCCFAFIEQKTQTNQKKTPTKSNVGCYFPLTIDNR